MSETRARESAGRIGTALAVGVIGGTALGLVESMRTLDANIHVSPGRYATVYLGVPMMLTTMSVMLLLLLVSALDRVRRGPRDDDPARLAATYGAVVGLLVVAGGAGLWARDLAAALRDTGSRDWWLLPAALAAALPVAAALAGAVGAGFGALWRWLQPPRRRRVLVGLVVGLHLAFVPALVTRWLTEARGLLYQGKRVAPREPGARNVLLVTLDTVRADRVGAYGSGSAASLTPAIDALARDGVLFERAISSSPWTLPALASVMTGKNPSQHGAGWPRGGRELFERTPLQPGPTLAGALQADGYFTQAIVTNPYLSTHFGLEQGFDGYQQLTLEQEIFDVLGATLVIRTFRATFPGLVPTARANAVTDRAIRWLGRHRADKFLLWVHYIDPHAPYVDPEIGPGTSFRGDTLLDTDPGREAVAGVGSIAVARLRAGEVRLSKVERAELVRLYDREVAFVDRQLGRLLAELERLGLTEDTVVVVLSDHGEEFWDHGGIEHGHTLYDELVWVPLVLRGPGLPRGARVRGVVRLVDVAPTVLDLLGLPAPADVQGTSLLPRLGGAQTAPLVAVSESMLFADEGKAVRTEDFKYVRWADGHEELYDLRADPLERTSLAACSDLGAARAVYTRAVSGRGEQAPVAGVPQPDPRLRAALRALGYAH
jgi:arylsulfatase A-like enzyme